MQDKKVLTELEGQHRVTLELLTRGYIPAPLALRTVACDLLVISPRRNRFGVEVKTNRKRNAWFSRRPRDSDAEIWVFVVLEPEPQFSVMTMAQVQAEWDEYQSAKPRKAADQGMLAGQVSRYEERWSALPT